MSQLAGEPTWRALLESGVRLYRYERTMLHAKVITVDHVLACIGSVNFNHRSFRKDDEVAASVLDPALTEQLDADFDDDLQHCDAIDDPGAWEQRSVLRKAVSHVARLVRWEV